MHIKLWLWKSKVCHCMTLKDHQVAMCITDVHHNSPVSVGELHQSSPTSTSKANPTHTCPCAWTRIPIGAAVSDHLVEYYNVYQNKLSSEACSVKNWHFNQWEYGKLWDVHSRFHTLSTSQSFKPTGQVPSQSYSPTAIECPRGFTPSPARHWGI